jgi:hypothetical protein
MPASVYFVSALHGSDLARLFMNCFMKWDSKVGSFLLVTFCVATFTPLSLMHSHIVYTTEKCYFGWYEM